MRIIYVFTIDKCVFYAYNILVTRKQSILRGIENEAKRLNQMS